MLGRIDLKRRGPIKDARTGKIDQPLPMRMRMRRMRRIECGSDFGGRPKDQDMAGEGDDSTEMTSTGKPGWSR
jgi:hypothetical protein